MQVRTQGPKKSTFAEGALGNMGQVCCRPANMLMDQKRGERVADGCQNPQQVARDRELQQRPVDLLR